ncbi:xanthine dehydrogenase accessory protein XdhC [Aurantimonas sp. 22II-16-19i]|uniref:xanthine dehydrogenase accessory protein XdhC n=1 Tax=Aurantimonas sp. 22II-16-19i TaxID=1317114 RepID=UPI0009F7C0E9|nr:xanthine dehydrogenase accessory protein XdhC [Aurantimonas sp. 22II-16-19i]ORE93891.1 xanthine dehydrogenase accessory protein XdhC [Aurantimonas sp. 22II-16-19i]
MTTLHDTARAALAEAQPATLVTVETALGSTPREAGACMLVTAGTVSGTIGGGRLEFDAIDKARRMIAAGEAAGTSDVPLGPELGQCCGGRVGLSFRRVDDKVREELGKAAELERQIRPAVLIFGAGHTGRALAAALAPLPLAVSLIDSRPDTLAGIPEDVRCVAAAMPEAVIEDAPPGAAYVVMTHEHSLDFLVAAAALARADSAYVGMIGSATKRARFRRHLAEEGRESDEARLTLPIGGAALRDKRPAVIAALAAAEIATCLLKHQEETMP